MKATTSLLSILALLILCSRSLLAQETGAQKGSEIYVYGSLKELTLTGITYKSAIRPNRFFRVAATGLDFENSISKPSGSTDSKSLAATGGFQIGLENRIKLAEKLSAFYGVDLYASVAYRKNEPQSGYINKYTAFAPGLSFGSGLILNVIRNLHVALEFEPAILVNLATTEYQGTPPVKNKTVNYLFDFNIDDVKLALVYKW